MTVSCGSMRGLSLLLFPPYRPLLTTVELLQLDCFAFAPTYSGRFERLWILSVPDHLLASDARSRSDVVSRADCDSRLDVSFQSTCPLCFQSALVLRPPRPALTRPPRSVLSLRPAGTSRLCFSGSFHKKSPAQTARGCGPQRARFLVATFPKSAARPWEQGTLASRCAGCSE
jgi:hypothetical protein